MAFLAWLLWPPNAGAMWLAYTQLGEFSCLITSYSVVLQNSSALLNSSSFCFSLFRQPWLTVGIRPLAWSHLSEKPLRLLDWGFWAGLGLPGVGATLVLEYWSLVWLDQHRKWDTSRRSPVETGFQLNYFTPWQHNEHIQMDGKWGSSLSRIMPQIRNLIQKLHTNWN